MLAALVSVLLGWCPARALLSSMKPGEFYLAEQLFPKSYVQPMKAAGGAERAQWLADWRAIAECFARFSVRGIDDAVALDQTRVALV